MAKKIAAKKAVAPAPIWKRKGGQHTAIIGGTFFLIEKRISNMGGATIWAIFGSNGYKSWASLLRIAKQLAEQASAADHKSPDACGVSFGDAPPNFQHAAMLARMLAGRAITSITHAYDAYNAGHYDMYILADGAALIDYIEGDPVCIEEYASFGAIEIGALPIKSESLTPSENQ